MTAHTLLLLLLASNVLGPPDSEGRLLGHYVPQLRQRRCSLGTCQMSRLPKIVYWLSFASTKELSGKAGHEPQDPHSYGRRRRRRRQEALVLLRRLGDPGLRQGGHSGAQLPR